MPCFNESLFALQEKINNEIIDIRDVLMNSDAVACEPEIEPIYGMADVVYHIPTSYTVQIDYNKLAMAIYNAGYRKGEIK